MIKSHADNLIGSMTANHRNALRVVLAQVNGLHNLELALMHSEKSIVSLSDAGYKSRVELIVSTGLLPAEVAEEATNFLSGIEAAVDKCFGSQLN